MREENQAAINLWLTRQTLKGQTLALRDDWPALKDPKVQAGFFDICWYSLVSFDTLLSGVDSKLDRETAQHTLWSLFRGFRKTLVFDLSDGETTLTLNLSLDEPIVMESGLTTVYEKWERLNQFLPPDLY